MTSTGCLGPGVEWRRDLVIDGVARRRAGRQRISHLSQRRRNVRGSHDDKQCRRRDKENIEPGKQASRPCPSEFQYRHSPYPKIWPVNPPLQL